MPNHKDLIGSGEHITFKPIYFTFEPPQPAPEYLGQYRDALSVDDLEEITGISKQTLRSELEAGNIPGCKIGRQWVIPKAGLIAFLYGRPQ